MDIDDIRHANLLLLMKKFPTYKEFGERVGIPNASQISQWVNRSPDSKTGKPRNISKATARRIEKGYPLAKGWMDTPHDANHDVVAQSANPADYALTQATAESPAVALMFTGARGSCGGGTIVTDLSIKSPMYKEPAWFERYGVPPEHVEMVWADGDSNAEFIVDGDIVFFDRRKREPKSGKLFLINHPDGLRIKQLRRDIDGTWVLESKNADKKRFPDERVPPEHAELLKIRGEFFYRQGG